MEKTIQQNRHTALSLIEPHVKHNQYVKDNTVIAQAKAILIGRISCNQPRLVGMIDGLRKICRMH